MWTEVVRAAVAAAAGRSVASVHHLPSLSGNVVFDVVTDDGARLAVRLPKDVNAAAREQLIVERLRGLVPMPEPLLVDLAGSVAGRAVCVWQWVDGQPLDAVLSVANDADAAELGRAVGKVLGPLASVQLSAPGWLVGAGLDVEPRERSLAAGVRRHVRRCLFETPGGLSLGVDMAEGFWAHVDASADELDALEHRHALVHGDLVARNTLVQQGKRGWFVSAVIDWEFALSGPPLWDVGAVLRLAPRPFEDALADSLRTGQRLPDNWRALAWLLDTVSVTGALARPEAHPDRTRATDLIVGAAMGSGEPWRY